MPFTFEVQHGVDDVLEHLRTGKASVLRDMPDEDRRNVLVLGGEQELRRRLAHLTDAARSRLKLVGPDRLHRIDHDKRRR